MDVGLVADLVHDGERVEGHEVIALQRAAHGDALAPQGVDVLPAREREEVLQLVDHVVLARLDGQLARLGADVGAGRGGRAADGLAACHDGDVLRGRHGVDGDGAVVALDLRGEQVGRDLGIGQLDHQARRVGLLAVGAQHRARAVDDAVRGLAAGVGDEGGRGHDAARAAEQGDHGLDGVDAHVHEGTGGHLRVKDVRVAAGLHVVVARGVLAEAEGGAAQGANLGQGVEDLGPGRVVDGAYGLERDDMVELGGGVERLRLEAVGADGLLHQDVLVGADAGERLLVVQGVGRGDVDGVDLVAVHELLEGREGVRAAVLLGELAGRKGVSRVGAHVGDALHLLCRVDEVVADDAGADGGEAQGV